MSEEFTIRPMQASDLARVLEIENTCYLNPWSAASFRRELDNPLAAVELLCRGGEIVGYLCSWLVGGELSILNVAVAAEFRRRGGAALLLRHIFDRSRRRGLERAFLEVRVGNKGAIALYGSLGFRPESVRKGYYPDGEDALIMIREGDAPLIGGKGE